MDAVVTLHDAKRGEQIVFVTDHKEASRAARHRVRGGNPRAWHRQDRLRQRRPARLTARAGFVTA